MRFTIFVTILLLLAINGANSSFWDAAPIVSQIKSLVQYISGDNEGAKQTQINFSKAYPPAALIRGIVEHSNGNHDEAKKTWTYLGKHHENMVDSLPVVGHIKGGVHYAIGDTNRGDEIMKSSTRSAAVVGGGALGFVAAGPAGAVAGGIAGGVAADGAMTGIESAIHNDYRPNGVIHSTTNIVKGKSSPGEIFDTTLGLVADGVGGYAAGSLVKAAGKSGSVSGRNSPSGSTTNLIRCRRSGSCGGGYRSTGWTEGVSNQSPHAATNSFRPVLTELFNHQRPVPVIPPSYLKPALGIPAITGQKSNFGESEAEVDPENPSSEDDKSEEKQKKITCKNQPQILHRNQQLMADCAGKKPTEKCQVRCEYNYNPSKKEIECVRKPEAKNEATWELEGVHCDPILNCKDANNNVVEWWIMYRTPRAGTNNMAGNVGERFLYMSNTGLEDPLEVNWSPIDNTLIPLQGPRDRIQFAMYSDQPPNVAGRQTSVHSSYAHAKGVFANRNGAGFYMPHTLPRFPARSGRRGNPDNTYGQIFMCISIVYESDLETIADHILRINAYIYNQNQAAPQTPRLDYLFGLVERRVITSVSFQHFDLFTKERVDPMQPRDIWSEIVVPWYNEDFYVLSWIRGHRLNSICPDNGNTPNLLAVENIEGIRYNTDLGFEDIGFESIQTQEHGKWAVGKNPRHGNIFCIGGMNRMTTQLTRSGDAICFRNNKIADIFREMVIRTDCNPDDIIIQTHSVFERPGNPFFSRFR